jgi:hypothetical protein
LDGTALVAVGVLVEELVAEALGRTGDLGLVEARGEDEGGGPKWWNGRREVPHVLQKYPPRKPKYVPIVPFDEWNTNGVIVERRQL